MKRKELIDYILKNGKTHTWYELALKFNIRPSKNRKERAKTKETLSASRENNSCTEEEQEDTKFL